MDRSRFDCLAGLRASLLFSVALAASAGEIVLYSSNSVDALNTVTTEFNKKFPDIKVSVVRGSTGAMMQRIKADVNFLRNQQGQFRR